MKKEFVAPGITMMDVQVADNLMNWEGEDGYALLNEISGLYNEV